MEDKTVRLMYSLTANPILQEMKIHNQKQYGVTQEYNSVNRNKLWDSASAKGKFKQSTFKDRKIYDDPISGQQLHFSQKAAQRRFRMKNEAGENISSAWARHSAEVDHVVSLKEIHNRVKYNPFFSDKDMKEIANQKSNFRVTSKSLNTSKGSKSDFELAFAPDSKSSTPGRVKLIQGKVVAEAKVNTDILSRSMKNAGADFTEGALFSLQSSAVPLVVEGVGNLYKVALGEKKFEDAAKDMGNLTLSVATTGGTIRVVSTGVTHLLENNGKEAIRKLANSNQVMQVITISLMLKDSIFKYVKGEIDGKQFFEEVGEKGVGMLAGTIGAIAGQALIPIPVVGAALGSLIISTVCMDLYHSYRNVDEYKQLEQASAKIASEALQEMDRQQAVLKQLIQEEYAEWNAHFIKGYNMIFNGSVSDSPEQINEGLSTILSVFSKNVSFENQKAFDDMFFDNNSVFKM